MFVTGLGGLLSLLLLLLAASSPPPLSIVFCSAARAVFRSFVRPLTSLRSSHGPLTPGHRCWREVWRGCTGWPRCVGGVSHPLPLLSSTAAVVEWCDGAPSGCGRSAVVVISLIQDRCLRGTRAAADSPGPSFSFAPTSSQGRCGTRLPTYYSINIAAAPTADRHASIVNENRITTICGHGICRQRERKQNDLLSHRRAATAA